MRVRRRPDQPEREALAPAPRPEASAVLRLQRQIGNHATSRLLAREAAAPPASLTTKEFGDIPLLSWTSPDGNTVSVTFELDDRAAKLARAASDGKVLPTAVIHIHRGGEHGTITMTGVALAGQRTEGSTMTLELQAESVSVDWELEDDTGASHPVPPQR
jgi:hypothetical protein